MQHRAASFSWRLLLFCTMILSACGGGGGSANNNSVNNSGIPVYDLFDTVVSTLAEPIGAEADPASCTAIGLSQSTGTPGELITVTDVPIDFKQPFFRSLVVLDSALNPLPIPIPLFATNTPGQYEFAVPSYMPDPMVGGPISLELSDSVVNSHCAGIPFTINALPQAVTTAIDARTSLDQLQTDLEEWADTALRHIGENPEDLLVADENTLPPANQLLWLSKRYVASDDEGALPDLLTQLTDDEAILLANLLAIANTKQRLADAQDALLASSPNIVPNVEPTGSPTGFSMLPTAISVPHISCEAATLEYKYNITTVEQLSAHMKTRKQGSPFDISAAGQLLEMMNWGQQLGDHLMNIMQGGLAQGDPLFDLLGKYTEKSKKAGKVMSIVGDIAFVGERLQQAMLAMEPSEISQFSLSGIEKEWIEDRPASALMSWDKAHISATGEEYNLYHVLLESTRQFGGKWVAKLLRGEKGESIYGVASQLTSPYLDSKFKEWSKDQCFRLKAPTYGPITFEDPTAKWTETRVRNGHDNVEVVDGKNYKGTYIGESTLETVPRIAEFPSVSGINLSSFFDVVVKEVRVAATPYRATNATSQTFNDVTAYAVAYSDNAADNIDATEDKGTINSRDKAGDTLTLSYTTPSNLSDLPAHIHYEWAGTTLDGGNANLRSASTTFDKRGHIELAPHSACLTPGEQLTITATIEGFPSANAIAWTGSHLTQGGSNLEQIFNASAPGSYTITAFSIDDPDNVFDETNITVAKSCLAKAWAPFVHYELNGNGTFSEGGDGCPPYGEPDNFSEEINVIYPEPPAQGELWVDRSETYSWPRSHQSIRYASHEDVCHNASFKGRNNSSATFSASSDGSLKVLVNFDLAGDIKTLGSSENNTGMDVDVSFAVAPAGYYYIPITANTTLNIEADITCQNVNSAEHQTMVSSPFGVMLIPYDSSDRPMMGWMPEGIPSPYVLNDITCEGSEMNFFNKTVQVKTFNNMRPSKVVLFISGGALGQPYPVASGSPADGFYETQSSIEFNIKVTAQ